MIGLRSLMLCRRYGTDEIVCGTAFHRRGIGNRFVVGMISGIVPAPVSFNRAESLEGNLRAFHAQADADRRHFRLPVDHLLRALASDSGAGRRLFDVALSWMPKDREGAPEFGGIPFTYGGVDAPEERPAA